MVVILMVVFFSIAMIGTRGYCGYGFIEDSPMDARSIAKLRVPENKERMGPQIMVKVAGNYADGTCTFIFAYAESNIVISTYSINVQQEYYDEIIENLTGLPDYLGELSYKLRGDKNDNVAFIERVDRIIRSGNKFVAFATLNFVTSEGMIVLPFEGEMRECRHQE